MLLVFIKMLYLTIVGKIVEIDIESQMFDYGRRHGNDKLFKFTDLKQIK
jgi:hypothetical protein